jgi:hypothetical protein
MNGVGSRKAGYRRIQFCGEQANSAAVGTHKSSPKVIGRGGKSEPLPANPRIRTLHAGSKGLFLAEDHGYPIPANQDGPSTPIDQAAYGECGLMDGNYDDLLL